MPLRDAAAAGDRERPGASPAARRAQLDHPHEEARLAAEKRAAFNRDNPVFMATQKVAQNRIEVAEKRRATWAAKREAKLALLPPEVAAKKRARAAWHAEWYTANKEDYNAKIRERRVRLRTSKSPPSCASTSTDRVSSMVPSDGEDDDWF